MGHAKRLSRKAIFSLCSFLLIFALGGQTALLAFGDKATLDKGSRTKTGITKEPVEVIPTEASIIPAADFGLLDGLKTPRTGNVAPQVGVDLGEESEPNDTSATADALTSAEIKIKGNIFPANDVDFYSFTAAAGDRVYAAVQTLFDASASGDSILEIIGTDGTTVLEADLNDGTFNASSSTIAGFPITAPGTYFIRVRHNTATGTIRPYFLYAAVRSVAPTPETEANDTTATANPLAASGVMSGVVNPAADADFFSVALNAGDSVFLSLNIDPERDNVQFNGRLGFGVFGNPPPNQILVANDGSTGSATNPLSEAFFFTVKDTGTYFIFVDGNTTAGSPTATYTMSATVIPPAASCTVHASTNVPVAIPTGPGMVSSTLTVPATAERIRSMRVFLDLTHTFMQDLDFHLLSPAGNNNGLATDIGAGTVGGPQTIMNLWIDENAALPPAFALSTPFRIQPELAYRLDWFRGENPSGTWQLDIRDDATGDGGTLNNWSLEICTEPTSLGQVLYSEDFEANDGGYTHSGAGDEWEYGLPNTVISGQNVHTTCGSGVNCWKTDLDNTYNASSNQDLFSPNLTLNNFTGTIQLEWAMRFAMESATFDHAFVEVQDVNNSANNRIVWQFLDATMNNTVGNPAVTISETAGWGVYKADISDFSGKTIRLRFHLDSDTTVQLSGLAIDDVLIRGIAVVAANVPVSGRVVDAKGNPISRARVSITGSNGIPTVIRTNTFGYYRFDSIEVGDTYILEAAAKGYLFSPRVITVQDEISDADFVAIE